MAVFVFVMLAGHPNNRHETSDNNTAAAAAAAAAVAQTDPDHLHEFVVCRAAALSKCCQADSLA
jgi:hypothetical protein